MLLGFLQVAKPGDKLTSKIRSGWLPRLEVQPGNVALWANLNGHSNDFVSVWDVECLAAPVFGIRTIVHV